MRPGHSFNQVCILLEAAAGYCVSTGFIDNCRNHKKYKDPLTTEELKEAEKFWIIQAKATVSRTHVGQRKDEEGILRRDVSYEREVLDTAPDHTKVEVSR